MAYSQYTPVYRFPQWQPSDKPTFQGDLNTFFNSLETILVNMQSEITVLQSRVNNANTQLRALGQPGV